MYCPMITTDYRFHFVTSFRISLLFFTSWLKLLFIDFIEVSSVGFVSSFLIWPLSHILSQGHVERFGWRDKKQSTNNYWQSTNNCCCLLPCRKWLLWNTPRFVPLFLSLPYVLYLNESRNFCMKFKYWQLKHKRDKNKILKWLGLCTPLLLLTWN